MQVEVERQLQPLPLDWRFFVQHPDFAAHAVDDHALGAVGAHQQLVINFLESRLADNVAALEALVFGDVFVARLAHVTEHVRGHLIGILARRHFLHENIRQFKIEFARAHAGDLRQRGILDDHDRPVAWLAAMPIDDLAHELLFNPGDPRQHADRVIEILGVLAHDGNIERVAVLDEKLAGPVVDDAARRAQGQRPLVAVLRHFLELGVLNDLEKPEPAGEHDEGDTNGHPQHREAMGEPSSIFGNCHNRNYRFKNRPARRLSTKPGSHSITWNATTPTKAFPNACPAIAG